MPKPASTRPAYKMLTCIYLCRTLLFFAPYADFLSKTSAYMGRHFYFLVSFRPVCRGLRQGLAKENTGAKRG